jgi:hypothetical protein
MTDNRCPKCDNPVRGTLEILPYKPKVPATACQHCKTPLVLEFQEEPVATFYYDYATAKK